MVVRASPRVSRALGVPHHKTVLYGAFVWVRRALNRSKRRFLAGRADGGEAFEARVSDLARGIGAAGKAGPRAGPPAGPAELAPSPAVAPGAAVQAAPSAGGGAPELSERALEERRAHADARLEQLRRVSPRAARSFPCRPPLFVSAQRTTDERYGVVG
jgi:hypothetical protein